MAGFPSGEGVAGNAQLSRKLVAADPIREKVQGLAHGGTRECLAIRVDRKLRSMDVIDVLSDLFMPQP